MNMEAGTASDRRMINRVGVTAAGLASATQLVDMAPFVTVRIDQTAAVYPLVITAREPGVLTADDDPALLEIDDDA